MAKKTFDINKRSKPMSKVIDEFEGKTETVEAVKLFETDPTIENKENAVAAVKADPALSIASTELLDQIQQLFIQAFSANTIPSNYTDLKREAKYLADLHEVSGIYMAMRLKSIKDNELYKDDDYPDFKAFIDGELNITERTVYNYLDLVEQFITPKKLHSKEDIDKLSSNRSKVKAYMPILKSEKISSEVKESLRNDVFDKLDKKSYRELNKEASELKIEYGLSKPKVPKAEKPLVSALTGMYKDIKKLSHPKANEAFIEVLIHLEMNKLISGKELSLLSDDFKKVVA